MVNMKLNQSDSKQPQSDAICTTLMQCASSSSKPLHPEIEKALTEKGELWAIAAIVDGSIGYFDPHGARRTLGYYIVGRRQDYCERCYCLYGGDLEKMLLEDIRRWHYFEKECPESFARTMKFIEAWSKQPEEPFGGAIGLAYPTINL